MKSNELRAIFLDYFAKDRHEVVKSSSLVPAGDPTLLFTNAGMVQFKGVFLNEESRDYKRAVSCQRCMRAGGKHNDLENVGRTARHHTFFEMLGNFSFGDYFKEGAIRYAWDFLTDVAGLPKDRLWVTVFKNDDEAAAIWQKAAGVRPDRIVRLGEKDNFWSMGDTGPCGPCSEILIDQGADTGCGRPGCAVGCDCDRFLEIWNLVFMQYNRNLTGEMTPLPKPCIDTGMGLERLSAVAQGKKSNYDSDLFTPIIAAIEDISGVKYGSGGESDVSIRAIADHSRAVTFLMTDGVLPSNEGRGYVLRRIIRRAARHGRFLGIKEPFIHRVNSRVTELMGGVYPEAVKAREIVSRATKGEEERFLETLERGLTLLDEEVKGLKAAKKTVIPGATLFKLYDTYGFPTDLTADVVKKDGLTVDEAGFESEMEAQRTRARASWKGEGSTGKAADAYKALVTAGVKTNFVGYHIEAAYSRVVLIVKGEGAVERAAKGDTVEIVTAETPFYAESGGQVGDTGRVMTPDASVKVTDTRRPVEGLTVHYGTIEEGTIGEGDTVELVPDIDRRISTARNHTATHLLHAALRRVLGEHVRQAGSLVEPGHLRFDFNHFEAVKSSDLRTIERDANAAVLSNIAVDTHVLSYREAVERGALAFFGEKYGDTVRMVQVRGVSAELCGGTHVKRTGDIGLIKITGESSVAAGVRRIEAVSGAAAYDAVTALSDSMDETAAILRAPKAEVTERIKKLIERQRELEREIEKLKAKGSAGQAASLLDAAREVKGVKVLAVEVEAEGPGQLREMADALRQKLQSGIVVLGTKQEGKALLLAAVTKDLTSKYNAGEIIKRLAPVVGGKGGGKPDMAQAGGPDGAKIKEAVNEAYKIVEEMGG